MQSVLAVAAVGGLVAALAERASNKNSINLPPGDHGDLAAGCCVGDRVQLLALLHCIRVLYFLKKNNHPILTILALSFHKTDRIYLN